MEAIATFSSAERQKSKSCRFSRICSGFQPSPTGGGKHIPPRSKRWVDALKCVVKEKRAGDPGFASNNKKWNLLDVLWVQNGQMDHSSFCDNGCQEGIRK